MYFRAKTKNKQFEPLLVVLVVAAVRRSRGRRRCIDTGSELVEDWGTWVNHTVSHTHTHTLAGAQAFLPPRLITKQAAALVLLWSPDQQHLDQPHQ